MARRTAATSDETTEHARGPPLPARRKTMSAMGWVDIGLFGAAGLAFVAGVPFAWANAHPDGRVDRLLIRIFLR